MPSIHNTGTPKNKKTSKRCSRNRCNRRKKHAKWNTRLGGSADTGVRGTRGEATVPFSVLGASAAGYTAVLCCTALPNHTHPATAGNTRHTPRPCIGIGVLLRLLWSRCQRRTRSAPRLLAPQQPTRLLGLCLDAVGSAAKQEENMSFLPPEAWL